MADLKFLCGAAVALGSLQVDQQLLGVILTCRGSLLLPLAAEVQGSSGPPRITSLDVAAGQPISCSKASAVIGL